MQEMKVNEQLKKPYTKPLLTHCLNIRTLTMGASAFPGESGGFLANPNPGSADSGRTNADIFENGKFEAYNFDNDVFD